MRSVLATCLITAVVVPVAAQDYRFANIPRGSDGATAKRMMATQRLAFQQVDSDSDYRFKGPLAGYDAAVWGLMANGGLAKVHVVLLTPNHKAVRSTWSE